MDRFVPADRPFKEKALVPGQTIGVLKRRMQCPQDRIAAVFLLREVTGNRCDPSLNRSLPLFGEFGRA
jgi:hypothetical protein